MDLVLKKKTMNEWSLFWKGKEKRTRYIDSFLIKIWEKLWEWEVNVTEHR